MTFSDIKDDVYFLTGSSSSSYPIADLTRNINRAYDRTVSLIMQADGRWQWDDTNNTDYPIATTALVSGQKDYTLSVTHLKILRVEVKDTNGDWIVLDPMDPKDTDEAISSFLDTDSLPLYYDKIAHSIFLYPSPDYSQAASLKVFYQRGPSYFDTTDTTDVPGFNALYHRLLSLHAAYDYAYKNQLPIAGNLKAEVLEMEQDLQDNYSLRNKDEAVRLKARTASFK
jgi:hypothetical protein